MLLTTLSVCFLISFLEMITFHLVCLVADPPFLTAKATDENLTAENWEFILVRSEA